MKQVILILTIFAFNLNTFTVSNERILSKKTEVTNNVDADTTVNEIDSNLNTSNAENSGNEYNSFGSGNETNENGSGNTVIGDDSGNITGSFNEIDTMITNIYYMFHPSKDQRRNGKKKKNRKQLEKEFESFVKVKEGEAAEGGDGSGKNIYLVIN